MRPPGLRSLDVTATVAVAGHEVTATAAAGVMPLIAYIRL
jgi:hypothetical protein